MLPEPKPSAPLILSAGLRVSGSGLQVTFDLLHASPGVGVYVLGLRAGDEGRHTIRHLTVTLEGDSLIAVATYDFLTGTRTTHPAGGASYSGTRVTACFPHASLAGLGLQPRITAFSSLDGHELQTDFTVDRHSGFPRSVGEAQETGEALRAVEAAASLTAGSGVDREHFARAMESAVAQAVLLGVPIADVAAAAHMTPLEVLDATDAARSRDPCAIEREDKGR